MAGDPPPVELRVDLQLGGAEHELDTLAGHRVGDVVQISMRTERRCSVLTGSGVRSFLGR